MTDDSMKDKVKGALGLDGDMSAAEALGLEDQDDADLTPAERKKRDDEANAATTATTAATTAGSIVN